MVVHTRISILQPEMLGKVFGHLEDKGRCLLFPSSPRCLSDHAALTDSPVHQGKAGIEELELTQFSTTLL